MIALFIGLLMILGGVAQAATPEKTPVGAERLERYLIDAPIFEPGVETRYFSSYDRTGGNDDGFGDAYAALYVTDKGEHVIFDALGPGCLYTLWFTSGAGGLSPFWWGRIRFYLDGSETPVLDVDANDLFTGFVKGFPKPVVASSRESTGGFVSQVPIPFRERLIITTEEPVGFYNTLYQIYPKGTEVKSWTRASSEGLVDVFMGTSKPLRQARMSEQVVVESSAGRLRTELTGPSVVTAIRFNANRELLRKELQTSRIRVWWDGEPNPSIDAPLGMFFGTGLHEVRVESIPIRMRREGAYAFGLPGPFDKSAVIEIDLGGGLTDDAKPTLTVEWIPAEARNYDPALTGKLKATFREERPTIRGKDFDVLNVSGAGKFIGNVMTIEPQTPGDVSWWEGDLRMYTNGARTPRMQGTGHEDDYLGGWSNEFLSQPYTLAMHGEPAVKMTRWEGLYNGESSLYRFYPGISFCNGIVVGAEHGSENDRTVNYKALAFWYEMSRPMSRETDTIEGCGRLLEGVAQETSVESGFEGREYKNRSVAKFQSHTTPSEFVLKIETQNRGVWLRKFYDQELARQTADVFVDGELVGMWYIAESNKALRFGERDFFLPASFTNGKEQLTIRVVPKGSVPWSVGQYRALTVLK